MNRACQIASDVISLLDDEEEEDVEIVFSNLDRSTSKGIQNELIKISEEIKLLQAMCKQTVPRDFNSFQNRVQKLGHQYSYDVVQSVWQRLVKKSNRFPNNVAPVCRVKPQTAVVSPLQGNTSSSSSVPSPLNNFDKNVAPTLRIGSSEEHKCTSKNDMTLEFECFDNTESIPSSSSLLIEDLDEISNSLGNNSTLPNSECDSGQTRLCENKELTQKSSPDCESANKQHVSINFNELEEVAADTINICSELKNFRMNKRCFNKSEKKTEVPDSSSNNYYLPSNISKKSNKKENSQLKNESSIKINPAQNSSKAAVKPITKSHVGVKAKIVKRKLSVECKLSEAELKKFKKEQKRLKHQQSCELELIQLQKVHDRLVDVLIPKYYKKI